MVKMQFLKYPPLCKSFLLTSVFLWAVLKGVKTKACAPTGIQALLAFSPKEWNAHSFRTWKLYSPSRPRECLYLLAGAYMFRAEDAHHVSLSIVLSLFPFAIYQLCRLLE